MAKKEEKLPKVKAAKPIVQDEIVKMSFDVFYSFTQASMDFNKPCHPDWYMLGASPEHYPLSDVSKKTPKQSYENYLKEEKNV